MCIITRYNWKITPLILYIYGAIKYFFFYKLFIKHMSYFFFNHYYIDAAKHKTKLNFIFYNINNKYKKFTTKIDVNKKA